MRYVICHGEYPKDNATFVSSVNVGLFVRNVGDPLPQTKALDILLYNNQPTHWLERTKCPDLVLTQIAYHEWFALKQALGSELDRKNPYFLPADTTLSALVAQLNDTELRMITCTVGGPTVTHKSDLVEAPKFEERCKTLRQARYRSAADAAAYVSKLAEGSRGFWLGAEDVYAIMTEWAIAQLPEVTDDVNSWVDTLSYLMVRNGLAAAMYQGSAFGFPDYGADVRKRIDTINTCLTDWPACVWRIDFATQSHPGFDAIRRYLDQPVGRAANNVTQCWQTVRDELKPIVARANAMQTGGLAQWHDYLLAVAALDKQKRDGLAVILNIAGWNDFIVGSANSWPDFATTWRDVVANYGTTIAPLLRASTDPPLRSRIAAAEAPPPVPQAVPVPGPHLVPVVAAVPAYRAYCEQCDTGTAHEVIVAMDVDDDSDECQVCQRQVGSSDVRTSLECRRCHSTTHVHEACLVRLGPV